MIYLLGLRTPGPLLRDATGPICGGDKLRQAQRHWQRRHPRLAGARIRPQLDSTTKVVVLRLTLAVAMTTVQGPYPALRQQLFVTEQSAVNVAHCPCLLYTSDAADE